MHSLLPVSLWHNGRISASHTGDSELKYSNLFKIILLAFREKTNAPSHLRFKERYHFKHSSDPFK